MTIYIKGLGLCMPGAPVSNAALAERFSLNEEWISVYLGNQSRYFATDLITGEQNFSLREIACQAAVTALQNSAIDKDQIGFIIMATATPDKLMPATVNEVAHQLNLSGIATYQLQSGCCGTIQMLHLANDLMATGRHRYGLVIGADVCHKFIDPVKNYNDSKPAELINFALFGDGAGAMVLSADITDRHLPTITRINYQLNQSDLTPGQIVNWQGSCPQDLEMLMEDYKAIEHNVPRFAAQELHHMLSMMQLSMSQIDWFLAPQLSGRMTAKIIETLQIPDEKAINCVAQTGNNGNALLLFQLSSLLEKLQAGQQAIAISIESSRWLSGALLLQYDGEK